MVLGTILQKVREIFAIKKSPHGRNSSKSQLYSCVLHHFEVEETYPWTIHIWDNCL